MAQSLTYHFTDFNLPTPFNLSKALDRLGHIHQPQASQVNDNLFLDEQAVSVFEQKHLLAHWVKRHCLWMAPVTFIVDELNYLQVASHLSDYGSNVRWILKPANLNNGVGIRLLSNELELVAYFKSSNRYGGVHVVQQYIEPPYLIDNKKISLRQFVVLVSGKGAFLYRDGYVNICRAAYSDSFLHPESHLTNEHLRPYRAVNNEQRLTQYLTDYEPIFSDVKAYCHALFSPWFDCFCKEPNKFAFLGVDFMLDAQKQLWLLEVNHGPCFPTDIYHPLYGSLYQPFWEQVIVELMLPNLGYSPGAMEPAFIPL